MAGDPLSALDRYVNTPPTIYWELRIAFRKRAEVVMFDIGSCEAEDAIRYALLFPHSRVCAFEPLPANVAAAIANITRFGVADRVEVLPLALSSQNGHAEFHVSSGHPDHLERDSSWNYGNKSSSLLPPAEVKTTTPWLEWNEVISVETVTLDELCRARGVDRVDFVHIDVQGAELMVLKGAKAMLPTVDMIWIEVERKELYEGQPLIDDVEEFMRANGFAKVIETVGEVDGDQLYVKPRLLPRMRVAAAQRWALTVARHLGWVVLSRRRARIERRP